MLPLCSTGHIVSRLQPNRSLDGMTLNQIYVHRIEACAFESLNKCRYVMLAHWYGSGVAHFDMPFWNSKKDLMTVLESPGCQLTSKTCLKDKNCFYGNGGHLEIKYPLCLS